MFKDREVSETKLIVLKKDLEKADAEKLVNEFKESLAKLDESLKST